MRKLTPRCVALLLAFGVGLGLHFLWDAPPASRRAAHRRVEIGGILIPAKVSHPDAEMNGSRPAPSSSYMILAPAPAIPGPGVNEPVPEPTPELDHVRHSCGLLVISVDESRRLKLNSEDVGTLAEPGSLDARLARIFLEREAHLAFAPGMERRDDLPPGRRTEKTAIIQPSRSLTYGEIFGLIDGIKKAGAEPIGLQVGDLKN